MKGPEYLNFVNFVKKESTSYNVMNKYTFAIAQK